MTARLLEEHQLSAAVSLGRDEGDVSSEELDVVAAGRRQLGLAPDLVRDVGGDYPAGVIYGKLGDDTHPGTRRGRDNLVARLDIHHLNIEEISFRETLMAAAAGGRLGYVHVDVSHRGQLGLSGVRGVELVGYAA